MTFQQGLSGLNAATKNIDVIGNNVSNANTVGFKGSKAQFADLFANALYGGGSNNVGIGATVNTVSQAFVQGSITATQNPLDISINGNGFFRVSNSANGGGISYTRNGQFRLDKDAYIVNAKGDRLTGYPVTATGSTVNASAPVDLQINTADIDPKTTTETAIGLNLDSNKAVIDPTVYPFNPSDTRTYNNATSMSVYDTLGNAHTVSMYMIKRAANTWEVQTTVDGVRTSGQVDATGAPLITPPATVPAPAGQLVFSSNGRLDTTTAAPNNTTFPVNNFQYTVGTGAAKLDFKLDFPKTTQFGSAFGVNTLTQDGYSSGRLIGFSVGGDGSIVGKYSNGQTRTQGQVVLSNFTNPNGLQSLGNNNWAQTLDSGQPLTSAPGSGSLGVLQSNAVEESNVDLTKELVTMITAQRVYQANAQTIKTQDSLLNTLVNLR
jgi:flagellar hook protein FlgE